MDIGAKFDDSLFEVADESRLQKVIEDEKNCCIREPLWFVDADPEGLDKDQEQMQLYKSQGDWLYYNKDHEGAARKYQQALGILPKGNATVKRDLLECISCCHIALGHENEALKYAHLLRDEGTNFEQQTVILNLLKSIHHQFGKTSGELIVLEKLLSLHPYNHHLWIELAEVFRIKQSQESESESDSLKLAAGNKNEKQLAVAYHYRWREDVYTAPCV
ncbi:uncharacterized protein C8orf76 homolog [Lingula anatina]|uniref:Uncharacterized protein C8orf76 homolog n=1 Tax=Lingula anatina TaxID=7574 RepID=A0A1S3HP52_LINAN|nr:uncharacterized protein C8orf76 homolog [Lingula anatina]|eukprot:XP_013387810.1 uncharacterized protein C8orf76 homolog [Lingula anatina]